MAVVKLYPPNIAGTLPSFYSSELGTTTELVVPFSMNISVSASMISGFSLRLKTTATDVILAELPSISYDLSKNQARFVLDQTITNKMIIGNFYKVQLAYYNTNQVLGYYSTTSIIKYTNVPRASLVGLTSQSINTILSQKVIGQYTNKDTTERVYQYQFLVYGGGELLEDSGWLLHNSQADAELTSSEDSYIIRYSLGGGDTYSILYNIKTNNGLEVSSAVYEVIMNELDTTDPGYILEAEGDTEYDNGGVVISVKPNPNLDELQMKGTYVFTRTSSDSDYKIWDIIGNFALDTTVTQDKPYIMKDYTVAAGIGYRYGLQRYNANNIFQRKIVTSIVVPYFEDIFLYDGKRQLKVRFNPKISSFKPVVQESKKTTLGKKFPYVLRNGVVNYKEFPISGLLSYLIDNDEKFMSKDELLKLIPSGFSESTNITDENMAIERKFKLAVLDWLNDGSIKLFRSPQEGNYLVRLTNVTLSPNDTVSRMIHTFSCTATEVEDYSVSALENYHLLTEVEAAQTYETTKVIDLYNFFDSKRFVGNNEAEVRKYLKNYDLTEGLPCRKVSVVYAMNSYEEEDPSIKRRNLENLYGTTFRWGEYNFVIGHSGKYEIELDEAIITPLRLESFAYTAEQGSFDNQRGYVILTLQTAEKEDLDAVTNSTLQYLCGYGGNGFDSQLTLDTNFKHYYTPNLLSEFNTQKTKLTSISYIKYRLFPVVEFNEKDLEEQWKTFVENALDTVEENAFYNNRIIIHWAKDGKYYKRIAANNYQEIEDYCTNIIFGDVEIDITKPLTDEQKHIIGVNTSIPHNSNGLINLQAASGVWVQVYGTAQTYDYSVETQNETMLKLKNAELKAYLNLCAAIYNFEAIAPEKITTNMTLFTFINRKFVRIDYDERNNYDQDSIFINNGLEKLADEDTIKLRRNVYMEAKKELNTALLAAFKEG